ncbi:uncharacterized protein J4E88_008098 [Alternaria novae-zelandiae]|uniref:uncharacterized protein n=1 Tax=Alternaria novae-zelandiae TaxID=430562 RepID=UPI0020C52A90|nr:uncharacterized protein J4E88_008098 [Alternaria novae-zelandiae]KAI4675193.1 hypothetical protein J4E88_008098 [Alternaria novae-zelandiae]
MRSVHAFTALAMTSCAAALPQSIPLGEVAEIPAAPITETPLGEGAGTKVVPYSPDAVVADTFASVLADPASADKSLKRRGWDCSEQPLGKGPVPSPDSPEAFLVMEEISKAATDASTPTGYVNKFKNLKGSNNAVAYLGYKTLDTYDTQACADSCTEKEGCSAFNIFYERDPSVVPADSCSNPASTTVIKCVLWGSPVTAETAVNSGQWRADFHVVIAGSNGYDSERVVSVDGYSGESLGNVAINAPNDCNGDDTYMGYKLFNDGQPFEPARCAAACEAETKWNVEHLNSRMLCKFFNTYVLMKNGEPQGQYCSMYTQKWAKSVAVNDGQYRGDDHYTIASSYSYSNTADPGKPKLPCDVAAAKSAIIASSLQPFCSTFLGYMTQVSTVIATVTATVPATTVVITDAPVTTTTTTVTQAPQKREVAVQDTPAALADFAPSAVSAACSLQATPVTETTTTSATTTATVSSGTVLVTTTLPVRTTIVTSVVAAAPTCTARGVNLVNNPGFEYGMAAWTQSQYGANGPIAWGVGPGGPSGGSSYSVTGGNSGTGTLLNQKIYGLTRGVTYTFSYKYFATASPAGSISCYMIGTGLSSQSGTERTNSWISGPTYYGGTFVAQSTFGELECLFNSRGAMTWRIDDFFLGC